VQSIAAEMIRETAYDRAPILADALLDAGCPDEALVAHLRADISHGRGCWALDLICGRD
jgi:hypothetical protein